MGMSRIQAVGTAVPAYALEQGEIKKFIAALFDSHIDHLDRLLPVFENSRIKVRHFSQPLEWYKAAHSFGETNKVFEQVALKLAEEASLEALRKANLKPEDIGMVVFVSSTGIVTPTLDAKLIQRLGLSPHTGRLPVWGLGCGGGVSGIARSAEIAYRLQEKSVLLVTVELCSLTFQKEDYSKSNLVGASLFADGAAAAVIKMNGNGPTLLDSYSTLFPNTEHIMGWDLIETGFKVRFSQDIPSIIKRYLPNLVSDACTKWGIDQSQICHYIVHPGGAKVLNAYQESLDLPPEYLKGAYDILGCYGNMSSASVLFVLEKFMKETPATGSYGIMLALGPGFSAEQVLFQW